MTRKTQRTPIFTPTLHFGALGIEGSTHRCRHLHATSLNVGTINEVTAIWFQAGGQKITEKKSVKVKLTKRVGFTRLVGSDEIDLIQALEG